MKISAHDLTSISSASANSQVIPFVRKETPSPGNPVNSRASEQNRLQKASHASDKASEIILAARLLLLDIESTKELWMRVLLSCGVNYPNFTDCYTSMKECLSESESQSNFPWRVTSSLHELHRLSERSVEAAARGYGILLQVQDGEFLPGQRSQLLKIGIEYCKQARNILVEAKSNHLFLRRKLLHTKKLITSSGSYDLSARYLRQDIRQESSSAPSKSL